MLVVELMHETHNNEISLVFIAKSSSHSADYYESLIKNILSSSEDLKFAGMYITGIYEEFNSDLDILDNDLQYIGNFEFSKGYFYDDLINKIAMEYAFNEKYSTVLDNMIEKLLNSLKSRNDLETADIVFKNYQKILETSIALIDNYKEMINMNYRKLKETKNNISDQGE